MKRRYNLKTLQRDPNGVYRLRVTHRKAYRKKSSRFLVRCGCCEERVEIYYDDDTLEINGVLGSRKCWGEILLPLLQNQADRTADGVSRNR